MERPEGISDGEWKAMLHLERLKIKNKIKDIKEKLKALGWGRKKRS